MLGYQDPLRKTIASVSRALLRAWDLLLMAVPASRQSTSYQRDLVDVTRQALGNLGMLLRDRMAAAYDNKDAAGFVKAAGDFMMLGRDLDNFLGSRSEFMLGKWIADARSWASNDRDKAYYEPIGRLSAFFAFSCSGTAASDRPASDKK
jgi:alpha-N-acetylglucosaminidase